MSKTIVKLSLTAGLSACSATVGAQVVLDVQEPVAVVYQPFQTLPEGEIMMVRITSEEDSDFDGEVEIVPTDAAEFEWTCDDPIRARLNNNEFRRETRRYVSPVSVNAQGEKVMMLRWRPENRAYAEPGRCDFLIDLRLLDTGGQVVSELSEIPISMLVLSDTALSVAGTSGSIDASRTFAFIDFGELETGESAYIIFNAQANSTVDFSIESENNGGLVSLEDRRSRIEYSATFDGLPLSLASGTTVRRRPDPTLRGSQYRLDVQIGDVEGAFAGTYRDNITVEMIAQ